MSSSQDLRISSPGTQRSECTSGKDRPRTKPPPARQRPRGFRQSCYENPLGQEVERRAEPPDRADAPPPPTWQLPHEPFDRIRNRRVPIEPRRGFLPTRPRSFDKPARPPRAP